MSDTPAEQDDLRATIAAAMTEHSAPAEPAAPAQEASPPPEKPEPSPVGSQDAKPGRARDETGKFAKAAEPPTPQAEKPDLPVSPAAQTPAAATPSLKAPDSWAAHMREHFGKLPPEVAAYVAQREADMNKKFTAQDEERTFGRKMRETVTPYLATIQQEGGTPEAAVAQLLQTAMVLRSPNPQIRAQALQNIARQFNVDIGTPLQQGAGQGLQQGFDPQAISRQVQAEIQRHQQEQEQASLQSEIEAFASAPGHEHYETLKPIMAGLLTSGRAKDLQDAYDQAQWSVPEIRTTLLASETQAAEQKRISEAAAKAEAAKRAAPSVTGSPSNGAKPNGAAIPERSLRDEIRANFEAFQGGRV